MGILLTLGLMGWSLERASEQARRTQVRLEALEDSLLSTVPFEQRLRRVERRMDEVEQGLSFASRAARVPDVIALRQWARRLDSKTLANSWRIAENERAIDSLRAGGESGGAADTPYAPTR
jgi:hypothetical protein